MCLRRQASTDRKTVRGVGREFTLGRSTKFLFWHCQYSSSDISSDQPYRLSTPAPIPPNVQPPITKHPPPSPSPAMNTAMQTSLDNVDNALAKLLDSIASYHPSPAAGQELKEADNQLTKNLETRSPFQSPTSKLLSYLTISQSKPTKRSTLKYKLSGPLPNPSMTP